MLSNLGMDCLLQFALSHKGTNAVTVNCLATMSLQTEGTWHRPIGDYQQHIGQQDFLSA